MPLIVHSSSHCDVCLAEYSWEEGAKRPHAIACGHIFCNECLFLNTPPRCPICRRTYQPNKMKMLHVGKPEEVDDNMEIDLLQRLATLWDAPQDQLSEIVREVDGWLANKSEQACVALRKARTALEHSSQLEQTVTDLSDDIVRLQLKLRDLQANSMTHTTQHATQLKKMARKIKDQNSIISRMQDAETGRYSPRKNPLPSPPRPVSTPDLPTFEQAYSQSAPGAHVVNLPSTPYDHDTENEKRNRARISRSNEHAYDTTRYFSPQFVTNSHYVQPHIATHREHSPRHRIRPSRLVHHFENTTSSISQNPYDIVEAAIEEYANGFVSGAEAAFGIGYPVEPQTAHVYATENDMRINRVVYPHSAPLPDDSPPRIGRRHHTMASTTISSSAPPLLPNGSPPRRRSASRGSGSRSRPPPQRSFTNPLLAQVLSDSPHNLPLGHVGDVETVTSSPGQQRPHNPPVRVEPVLVHTNNALFVQAQRPASPSATITSWGTGNQTDVTDGSLIPGLHTFRNSIQHTFEGGEDVIHFRALGSDGQSIHTSPPQSMGDLASEMGSQFSGSPPRPIGSMVGVLPEDHSARSDDLHTAVYRPARSWDGEAYSRSRRTGYDSGNAERDRNSEDARSSVSGPPTMPYHHPHAHIEPAREEPALATNWRHGSSRHGRGLLRDSVALPLAHSPNSRNYESLSGYRYFPQHADAPGSELSGNALGLELSTGAGAGAQDF